MKPKMIQVFSKEWFAKYNKQLCWLANSFLGQFIFKFRKYGHYTTNKIVRITPNSIDEFVGYKGDKLELKAHFFSRNEYALRLQKVFYPVWITFHIWDIITRPIPQLNLGFDTLTVYPDADTETNTVDGGARRAVTDPWEDWNTIRTSTGTDANYPTDSAANGPLYFDSPISADKWKQMGRLLFLFDTSSLTASAVISGSVFSVYGESKNGSFTALNTFAMAVTSSNPNTNTATIGSDYATLGTTRYCDTDITYSAWNITDYNDFTFNSTGNTNVSKTSITKLGARWDFDIDNAEPTWESSKYALIGMYFADNGSNKPKLVVTYTLPVTDTGFFLMF